MEKDERKFVSGLPDRIPNAYANAQAGNQLSAALDRLERAIKDRRRAQTRLSRRITGEGEDE